MKYLFRTAALALAALGAGAYAQQPALERPVHLVVPFASGGATDAIGRVIARRMAEVAGQPVVVENKPGAGGTIGIDHVARAPADSNTIVLVNALQHTSSAKLYPDLKYDAIRSFKPLASIGVVRYMLLVNTSSEAKDYASFLRMVRGQPGKFNYASAGTGSAPHLVMELFVRAEGLSMVHVPYNGSGPAMTDLAANHVHAAMDNVAAVPLIKAGRLRPLAISGAQRWDAFPDVPTFQEAGAKGFDVAGVWGFLAPAAMPERTAAAIADAIQQAMKDPAVRDALVAQGIQPQYGNGAAFAATLREESGKWSKLIDQARIKL
ncbi:MAG TPA: tripartite tricarboxylate transporter substrate-binding protein [Ramlibacter sp.]|nr:tripartite tricarboxylate transporter substrate-binding protein [Ramlibacter sp.]